MKNLPLQSLLRRAVECVDWGRDVVLVTHVCWDQDDSLVRAFFADRGCLTGWATDSSSSDDCGVCRFPLDCAVSFVTCLVTASDLSMGASATARTSRETSSPSMGCFPLPCPVDCDDPALCLEDFLFDFLFAEVAEDGFRVEVHARITYFWRQNVWWCLYYYGGLGRLNQ